MRQDDLAAPTCGRVKWFLGAALLACALHAVGQDSNCGPIANHYGPFDYRTQRHKLKIVEDFHFTPEVEALLRGKSSSGAAGDISYLMRTSPNHHRGLIAVVGLAEKMKSPQPIGLQYPVECYFERAVRFAQDDTVVRVLYARYLHRQKRSAQGLEQLRAASGFAQDNALSHFNIGLTFFELGDYDHAVEQAHKARALGIERDDLEERLKAIGKWKAPTN